MSPAQIKALVKACGAALALEKTSTLPAEQQRALSIVAVCQFCLESATPPNPDGSGGWGTSTLSQPPHNNPFGIKFSQREADYGHFDQPTWEIINGKKINILAQFQQYPDLATAFAEHQRLLLFKIPVRNVLANGWQAICTALGPPIDAQHCGYSTNPKYASVLIQIGAGSKLDRPGYIEWYAAGAQMASEPLT
jgi:flagellum-specific peptidoglycan hydrolase FlgJ